MYNIGMKRDAESNFMTFSNFNFRELKMASINSFTVIGRVTKDVQLRYLPNGTALVNYAVAVSDVWYDKEGDRQEACDFIPISVYGPQAENDAKYLKKGDQVAVTGAIRSWYKAKENKGGFNFVADKVLYLSKAGGHADAPKAQPNAVGEWADEYAATEAFGSSAGV